MSNTTTPRTSFRHGVALAVAAFMAFGAVANASAEDTKDKMEKTEKKVEKAVSDSWITTKVKSEILANSVTKAFKVSVKTLHGAVKLNGKLPNQEAIDQVKQIAEKVKGVNSVDTSKLVVASS